MIQEFLFFVLIALPSTAQFSFRLQVEFTGTAFSGTVGTAFSFLQVGLFTEFTGSSLSVYCYHKKAKTPQLLFG